MKGKAKKVLTVMISAVIGAAVFTGCGNKVDEAKIETIQKAKELLVQADNINLTREIKSEVKGESQSYGNDVIINNNTGEWYNTMFNTMDGQKGIFTEMIVLDGEAYSKVTEESKWEKLQGQEMDYVYGLDDIASLELQDVDYEDYTESKNDDNIIISIKPSKAAIKKIKEKSVKNMEEVMEEYKNNPDVVPMAIESNMANLEALRQTNYKAMEYTFTINKNGVLVGFESFFVFEQPEIVPDSDGKFVLGEERMELKMTSNIIVNSFNDSKNEEFINKIKGQL